MSVVITVFLTIFPKYWYNSGYFYFNSWKNCHLSWYWDWWKPFLKQKNRNSCEKTGIFNEQCFVKATILCLIKNFSFNLLRSLPIVYSIWLYSLAQKNIQVFVLQKKCTRLLTFSDYCEHTSPIFKRVLKLHDIMKFSILELYLFLL